MSAIKSESIFTDVAAMFLAIKRFIASRLVETMSCTSSGTTESSRLSLDQIVDAHKYLEGNQQFGKIVVTV